MSAQITRDEWLKAIADTMPPAPVEDAITVREFSELAGCAFTTAMIKLKAMEKAGKARRVRKKILLADGRWLPVVAFQLVKTTRK